MRVKSWNEYASERESKSSKSYKAPEDTKTHQLVQPPEAKNIQAVGEPMDYRYRDDAEYKKLLEFLRGKKNVPDPPKPPPEAPKGWFIVDESSKGFWCNNNWTQDTFLASEAVISDEKAAHALAGVVGGIVIPSNEILG